jgi:phosphate starvation-inducible PhoH-like protein
MPRSKQRQRRERREEEKRNKQNSLPMPIEPKSTNQKKYFRSIKANLYTFVVGPPGTGKTFIALWNGLKQYYDKNSPINKIVIVRPLVGVSNFDEQQLGALPGDAQSKMSPWMGGIMDSMRLVLPEGEIKRLIAQEVICFYPIALCRGRSFTDTFLIVDEAQNITVEGDGMKMLLTRLGRGSKMVIAGDIKQSDIGHRKASALKDAIQKFYGEDGFGITILEPGDIQRNGFISVILEKYGDYNRDEGVVSIDDILEDYED